MTPTDRRAHKRFLVFTAIITPPWLLLLVANGKDAQWGPFLFYLFGVVCICAFHARKEGRNGNSS